MTEKLRFSVSLVTQGNHRFYTLTMPSDVLARTCFVSHRHDDPVEGFQRVLDRGRAEDIAHYIDDGGVIPNSIVLSAQPDANAKILGRGKTLEFDDNPKAFLVLDGQHRVYGFTDLANLLGVTIANPPAQGSYTLHYNSTRKEISMTNRSSARAGFHETFWAVFQDEIDGVGARILATNKSYAGQQTATALANLRTNLSYGGGGKGSWLSMMRNQINYAHNFGAWFPYRDHSLYFTGALPSAADISINPLQIDLGRNFTSVVDRFLATCQFLVCACTDLSNEISKNSTLHRCFLEHGPFALRHLAGVP